MHDVGFQKLRFKPPRAAIFSTIGKRANNEDSANYILQKVSVEGRSMLRFIAVVADGMGGHAKGEVASRIAVNIIPAYILYQLSTLGIEEISPKYLLEEAYSIANSEIVRVASSDPSSAGMGTTATTVVVHEGGDFVQVWIGHVGDSRAYLVTFEGIFRLTRDHSMVQEMVDKGMLTPEQALRHPNRNVITKALGGENTTPDTNEFIYDKPFFILLCTDGLVHTITEQELYHYIIRNAARLPYSHILRTLCQEAVKRGENDNVTALLAGPFAVSFSTF